MGIYDGISTDDYAAQRAALEDVAARRPGTRAITDDDLRTSWSDYARAAGVGALGIGESVSALSEYATGFGETPRKWFSETGQDQYERLSPRFRGRLETQFLPDEEHKSVFDEDGLFSNIAAKATVAAPSIIASIIPAGLVSTVTRGAGAAMLTAQGTAGALQAGDVASQIASTIDKTSDANLEKLAPAYRQYLAMGLSPQEARARYRADVQGVLPLIAGAISAAIPGVESQVAGRLGGHEAAGLLRGAARGFGSEALQEGVESAVGARFSNVDDLDDFTWRDLISQTLEGAAVGGALGGATGALAGVGRKSSGASTTAGVGETDTAVAPEPGGPPAPEEEPPVDRPAAPTLSPAEQVKARVAKTKARNEEIAAKTARAVRKGLTVVDPKKPAPDIAVALAEKETPPPAPAATPVPDELPQPVTPEVPNALAQPAAPPVGAPPSGVQPVGGVPDAGGAGPVLSGGVGPAPAAAPAVGAGPAPAPTVAPTPVAQPSPIQSVLGRTPAGKRILADLERARALDAEREALAAPETKEQALERNKQALAEEKAAQGDEIDDQKLEAEAEELVEKEAKPKTKQSGPRFGKAQADLVARGEQGFSDLAGREPTRDDLKTFHKRMTMVMNAMGDREPANDMLRAFKKAWDSGSASDIKDAFRAAQRDENERAGRMEPVKKGKAAEKAKATNKRKDNAAKLREIYENARPKDIVTAKSRDQIRDWVYDLEQALNSSGVQTLDKRVDEKATNEDTFAVTIKELARAFRDKKNQPSDDWLNDFRANTFFYYSGEGERIKEHRKADAVQMQKSNDAAPANQEASDGDDIPSPKDLARDDNKEDEVVEAGPGAVLDLNSGEAVEIDEGDIAPVEEDDTPVVTRERAKVEIPPDAYQAVQAKAPKVVETVKKGGRRKLEPPPTLNRDLKGVALKKFLQKETAEQLEEAPKPRRRFEFSLKELAKSKEPGFNPVYRKILILRGWVNSLSDADYQRLVELAPYGFPRSQADTEEPGRLLAAWQQTLEKNQTVWLDPGKDADERSRIDYDPVLDAAEKQLIAAGDQLASTGWDSADTSVEEFADLDELMGRNFETISNGAGTDVQVYDKRTVADDIERLSQEWLVPMLGKVNAARWEAAAKGLLKRVPVYTISPKEMAKYRIGVDFVPAGLYDARFNRILIRSDVMADAGLEAHVLVHEVVHAVTHAELKVNSRLRAEGERLLEIARAELAPGQYGLKNLDEFISEAFSNRDFQRQLAEVRVPGSMLKTVWDEFKRLVRKAIGFIGDDNLLNAVLDLGAQIEEAAAQRKDNAVARLMRGRQAPVQLASNAGDYTKAAIRRGGENMASVPSKLRKVGLVLSTLDQIRQQAMGLFVDKDGDVVDDMVKAMQRIEPRAREAEAEGHALAQKFIDWAKGNAKEAVRLATLGTRATGLNITLTPGVSPADVADALQVINGKKDISAVSAKAAEVARANKHLGKNAFRGWQGKADLAAAHAEFNALSPEAQKLYIEMRDFYRQVQRGIAEAHIDAWFTSLKKQYSPAITAQIKKSALAGSMKLADKQAMADDKLFDELRRLSAMVSTKGDYFPAMRYGEYVVTGSLKLPDPTGGTRVSDDTVEFRASSLAEAKRKAAKYAGMVANQNGPVVANGFPDPDNDSKSSVDFGYRLRFQVKGAHFFESRAEAMRFIKENPEGYDVIAQEPVARSNVETMNDLTPMQVQTMIRAVNARLEGDENKEKRELFQKVLREAAVRSMAGSRIQQRTLLRREVRGASTDYGRNLVRYAHSSARHLARLNYMPVVDDAFKRMRKIHGDAQHAKGAEFRSQVMNELNSRLQSNLSGTDQAHPVIQTFKSLSFIDKLFSPAWSVLNAAQPWMVTLPHMAGRHGAYRVARELSVAYREIMAHQAVATGVKNTVRAGRNFLKADIDATDPIGSIKANLTKAKDGAALVAMVDELIKLGRIDPAAGFELASVEAEAQGPFGQAIARTDRIARQLPSAIEQVNRTVTAIAAYRLAKASGMNAKAATDYAADVVSNTQGDYSVLNAPKYFNHPYLGAALQFKKYGQMMYALMTSAVYRAFKGATPEVKAAARKELLSFIGMQVMMAGALGIPGMEVVKLGAMMLAGLGFGGGYDDVERWVREELADVLGPTAGELLAKGVVPRAVGIDLSSRVGMDSLLTFGEPKKYETDHVNSWLLQTIGGAPASLLFDQFKAAHAFVDGDYGKTAELIPAPKFINDVYKATRGALYGRQSRATGKTTSEPLGIGEAVVNAVGFRTAGQAEEGAKLGAQYKLRGEVERRSRDMSKLKNQYVEAKTAGEKLKVLAKINQLNTELPAKERVTPAKLSEFASGYKKAATKGAVEGPFRLRNKEEADQLRRYDKIYNAR